MKPHELARSSFFKDLSPTELTDIAALMTKDHFQAGETIFEQGTPGDYFFYIASGSVRVWLKLEDGGARELAELGPGQFFGELALLDKEPRTAGVEAVGNCEVWKLERDEFLNLLRGNAQMAVKLLQVVGARLRRADEVIQMLSAR
ncbi:MAG TPA: cyclic nucleotide-binding domain-containing protein [bacterium]|nr:cyclic nucleotide-binding domain-containing protein [bacterium]